MKHGRTARRSAALALAALALSTSANGQTTLSAEDAERLRRIADGPTRFILLQKGSKPKAPAPAVSPAPAAVTAPRQPLATTNPTASSPSRPNPDRRAATAPSASSLPKPEPETSRTSAETAASTPTSAVAASGTNNRPTPAAELPASANAMETEQVQAVIDMDKAVASPQGLVSDPESGGYVTPIPSRYSERNLSSVKASMAFDAQARLLRVDYSVPASVGAHGGTNVFVQLPGDGADLSGLLLTSNDSNQETDLPPPGSGLLEIELDSTVPTRLKIALVGPEERSDGAYPYFILPVQPGRRIYGLWLTDFRQAHWVKSAPDLPTTLRRVLAVSVGYSRGDANGLGDEGRFSIGQVAFLRRPP